MNISNEKSIKKQLIHAHGGSGLMNIRFAFPAEQHWGNNNEARWNCFAIAVLPIGATAGYHKHINTDEIFYIIEGMATVTIDDKAQQIKKGDVVLTKIGSSHGITDVKEKLKFIVVEILRG